MIYKRRLWESSSSTVLESCLEEAIMLFSRNIFFVSGLSSKKTYFLFQCFFGQKKLVCPLKMIYKRQLSESSSSILLESCWEEECDRVAYWRLPVFMRWTTWSTGMRLKQYHSICNRFLWIYITRNLVYIISHCKYCMFFYVQSPFNRLPWKLRPCCRWLSLHGSLRLYGTKNYHSNKKFTFFQTKETDSKHTT